MADRENRNQRLQEQVEELKKIKNFNVESSAEMNANKIEETQDFIPDKRTLTIVDSERMRLLELLAVVNRRLDESRKEKMEADTQIRKEKFKNAKLETKVARLELERVGVLKTGRGSYSHSGFKPGDIPLENVDITVSFEKINSVIIDGYSSTKEIKRLKNSLKTSFKRVNKKHSKHSKKFLEHRK